MRMDNQNIILHTEKCPKNTITQKIQAFVTIQKGVKTSLQKLVEQNVAWCNNQPLNVITKEKGKKKRK